MYDPYLHLSNFPINVLLSFYSLDLVFSQESCFLCGDIGFSNPEQCPNPFICLLFYDIYMFLKSLKPFLPPKCPSILNLSWFLMIGFKLNNLSGLPHKCCILSGDRSQHCGVTLSHYRDIKFDYFAKVVPSRFFHMQPWSPAIICLALLASADYSCLNKSSLSWLYNGDVLSFLFHLLWAFCYVRSIRVPHSRDGQTRRV